MCWRHWCIYVFVYRRRERIQQFRSPFPTAISPKVLSRRIFVWSGVCCSNAAVVVQCRCCVAPQFSRDVWLSSAVGVELSSQTSICFFEKTRCDQKARSNLVIVVFGCLMVSVCWWSVCGFRVVLHYLKTCSNSPVLYVFYEVPLLLLQSSWKAKLKTWKKQLESCCIRIRISLW